MFLRWNRSASAKCEHQQTISVRAAGIERVVCERCSHVSFSMVDDPLHVPGLENLEGVEEKPRSLAG